MTPLAEILKPCGPVLDERAARRTLDLLRTKASAPGADLSLRAAEAALAPIFGASGYLSGLARRHPDLLLALIGADPGDRLEGLLDRTARLDVSDLDAVRQGLRLLKAEAHLLIALADLGQVWNLDQVTAALTRFADAALQTALGALARVEFDAGRLRQIGAGATGPIPGFSCIAMGKQGSFELNYSSDIDVSIFYDPDALPLSEGVEVQGFAVRLAQGLSEIMQARTADGYVFRMDLRLRPDPASTPIAVSLAAALEYYESVGQNWERAAFIKARACAGDLPLGEAFLDALQPFIWRRNLDFAAISDIHSIKRQIHIHKVDDRLTAGGMDLKLGRGGIREIEFFVQTQQLILGGRHPELRSPRTLDGLAALCQAGHVSSAVKTELTEAYEQLRALEHRIQMLADEQTHRLPESANERKKVAALSGFDRLGSFDAAVIRILRTVNRRYGELFAGEEPLSSRFGSLIFTGVEDDPQTLETLARMGFSNPSQVSETIRAWHHGRIAATRPERGRELFTRLAPRLLEACHFAGAPDLAFIRFGAFFGRLSSAVQLQSLFLAQPVLFNLLVQVMAYAPRLADTLARQPAAIDAMLDGQFLTEVDPAADRATLSRALAESADFETAMDVVRRFHREQSFRVGVQVMSGRADAELAGLAFAKLADICLQALAPVALADVERTGGAFEGEVAVVALGRCGSREMNAGSDLDLMTLYRVQDPDKVSALKGWSPAAVYGRFTQRLIAALSLPTREGGLYEVDMQLRPSGTQGPVAVSLAAFEDYYSQEAETWELMSLTRARVVWSNSPDFEDVAGAAIETALRRPRDIRNLARDVREMRVLVAQERPPSGPWDLKLSTGGLMDIEFIAQFLQLRFAASGGPLNVNTLKSLEAMAQADTISPDQFEALRQALRLQQDLTQVLKLALTQVDDPLSQPLAFRRILARAAGIRDPKGLPKAVKRAQTAVKAVFEDVIPN